MPHYHERTNHSYESVRQPFFLDWASQPAAFKHYPRFLPRIPFATLDDADFWPLINGITETRSGPNGDDYHLRTTPSAGGLFPVELYLQCRDRSDLPDGLYHYAADEEALVSMTALGNGNGLEPLLGLPHVEGLIFIISNPYFRSAWKYRQRSLRYCGLDSGHLVGAIEAACGVVGYPFALAGRFNKQRMAAALGFGPQEWAMAAVISGRLRPDLPRLKLPAEPPVEVSPSDYFEPSEEMERLFEAYEETLVPQETTLLMLANRAAISTTLPRIPQRHDPELICYRRSIRQFQGLPMERDELERLWDGAVAEPPLECWTLVHRVRDLEPGLYRNGELVRSGDFREIAGRICLEQALGSDCGALFFLTGKSERYQRLLIEAGWFGQRLYLAAAIDRLGVSGIGAYYDEEVQEFLGCDDWVIYALAVGR